MDPWNTQTQTPMKKGIPILSEMSMANKVITHSDNEGLYSVALKREHGLVVLFGPMLFSDRCWTLDSIWSESSALPTQMQKCESPAVFMELKKLQQTAERNKIPRENVLLVDCSGDISLKETLVIVQMALSQDISMTELACHVQGNNSVGAAMTKVFQEEIWDQALFTEEPCMLRELSQPT